MKKILFNVMIVTLIMGLVGAGAYALFNDSETSSHNTFTAGSLDLKVDIDPTSGVCWTDDLPSINSVPGLNDLINNLKPGDCGMVTIDIKNAGSIDGIASIAIKNLVNSDNGSTEPEIATGDTCETGELGENVWVTISYGCNPVIGPVTLNSLNNNPVTLGALDACGTGSITITACIPCDVGNIIQTDQVMFDVELILDQAV